MSIVHIPGEIKKEFKVTSDGVAIVSIKGAARIAGVTPKALRENLKFKGGDFSTSKMPETLTVEPFNGGDLSIQELDIDNGSQMAEMLFEAGFDVANLKSFAQLGIPDTALAIILEYYTFEAGRNRTLEAKAAYRAFAAIGIRTWVQHELGYARQGYSSEEQPHLLDTITDRQLSFLKAMWHCGTNRAEIYAALRQQVPEVFRDMPLEVCFQMWGERALKSAMPDLEHLLNEEIAQAVYSLDKKILTDPDKLQYALKQIEEQVRQAIKEQPEVKRRTEMATEPTNLEVVREFKAQLDLNQHLLPASERKPLPPLGMAKFAVGLEFIQI